MSSSNNWNKKQKAIIKRAHQGKPAFGGNFDKVAAEAGGGEKGKRIAASIYWKKVRKVK